MYYGLETFCKSNIRLLKANVNVLLWSSQSFDLNPIKLIFHMLKAKLKTKHPINKQEVKTTALKSQSEQAW